MSSTIVWIWCRWSSKDKRFTTEDTEDTGFRSYATGAPCPSVSSVVESLVTHRHGIGLGEVHWPETHRLESFVYAALGVVRRPSRLILKEADRANAAIRAQVEPVMRAFWHANEVARLHFDGKHRARARMDVKQAPSLDDEAYFVFIVPVFGVEPDQHRLEARCGGVDVDDVRRDVPAPCLQLVNLPGIRTEQLFRRARR